MKIVETFKVQVLPNSEQVIQFRELQHRYIAACNRVSQWIFEHDFELTQRKVHDALYYDLRDEFKLLAQITQSVIRTVISRYKTVQTKMKSTPYTFRDKNTGARYSERRTIEWLQKPIAFNQPVAVLLRNRDYSVKKEQRYSIATLTGRETVPYIVSDSAYFNKFTDGSWAFGAAELIERHNKWYLHIAVSKEVVEFDKSSVQHVVGIDRGLRQLVTSYDEQGKTHFFTGQDVMKTRRKFKRLRQQLQSKNTKSSKKRSSNINQRENRWMSDVNHQISKALVDYYGSNTLFVLEDLTNVRFATEKHAKSRRYEAVSWAFYDLEQKLSYKATEASSLVIKVARQYTSQRCPKCGTINKESRLHVTHEYCCQNCNYRSNDDRVAAMNIQHLGTEYIAGVENPRFTKLKPTDNA